MINEDITVVRLIIDLIIIRPMSIFMKFYADIGKREHYQKNVVSMNCGLHDLVVMLQICS